MGATGYDHGRSAFADYSNKLNLARVESYVFATDENTGELIVDENNNRIPSGLLNIRLLESNAPRKDVPYVMPMTGNAAYMGGLPEIGSYCVVGFRQQNQPIIIGFLPFGIDNMVRQRRTIPNLEEGEVYLQASNRTVDIDNTPNFFRGARVWLDRYGRIRIDTTDYDLTIGYILSDEFEPNVQMLFDEVTGENVFLRETLPGGTIRRADDKGNIINQSGGSTYEITGQDKIVNADSRIEHVALQGQIYRDASGNKFEITEEGSVLIESPSGNVEIFAQGSHTVSVSGHLRQSIIKGMFRTVGERFYESVQGDVEREYGGSVDETISGGSVITKITDGKKEIIAKTGITLETTDQFAPVKIGSDGAKAPLTLGDIAINMMNQLKIILETPPGIGFGNLGGPVPLNPAIIALLAAWKIQFLDSPATNIVSRKAFTERGT